MKKERIIWGILFIIGAICLLFSHTEFIQGLRINIWNMFWTLILISILIKSVMHRNFFGIFFPIAILCVIHKDTLGFSIAPWTFFSAAILLSIGCNMLFPQKWGKSCCSGHYNSEGSVNFDEVIDNDSNEHVNQEVNFGSCIKYVNSNNFISGHFECNFGALKVYFTNTIMQDSQATIHVKNNFGGTELYIPKEWIVVNQIHCAFGGVDEKGYHQPTGTHTLYIQGECSFGGIDIIYI